MKFGSIAKHREIRLVAWLYAAPGTLMGTRENPPC
jgi:hypothetical protein